MFRISLLVLFSSVVACGGTEKGADTLPTTASEGESEATSTTNNENQASEGQAQNQQGMSLRGLKGHLDPHDIQATVQNNAAALSACYTDAFKKARYLGGAIEMSYTVALDGTVKNVRMSKSTVGSWSVENCLLEVSQQMTFPQPTGNAAAEFKLPLEFPNARVLEEWTEDEVAADMPERLPELDVCTENTTGEGPRIKKPRKVAVTLYLGNRGVVKQVGFASEHPRGIDARWATCAATTISAWSLTDPKGSMVKLSFRYN